MYRYTKSILFVIAFLGIASLSTAQTKGKIKTVTTEKFQKKLKNTKNAQIIDVRTAEEFTEAHIRGAINYNVMDSTLHLHLADLNPKKPVLVYCRSGVRSKKAAELLKANGFRVINLKGGITGWKEKDLPVETGTEKDENL